MRHSTLRYIMAGLALALLLPSAALAGAGGPPIEELGGNYLLHFHEGLQVLLITLGAAFLIISFLGTILNRAWIGRSMAVLFLACATIAALHFPALAQAAAGSGGEVLGTTTGAPVVTLPYGEWIAGAQAIITTVLTVVATAVVAWLPLPLRWAVNLYGVEKLVKNAVGFAIAATPGAARDSKLDVSVGSQVLARALQKILDEASPRLIKAAGGTDGIAEKIIAQLPLAPEVPGDSLKSGVVTSVARKP